MVFGFNTVFVTFWYNTESVPITACNKWISAKTQCKALGISAHQCLLLRPQSRRSIPA